MVYSLLRVVQDFVHQPKDSNLGSNVGALIVRILSGFEAHYTTIIIRNPNNNIGSYLGFYSTPPTFIPRSEPFVSKL